MSRQRLVLSQRSKRKKTDQKVKGNFTVVLKCPTKVVLKAPALSLCLSMSLSLSLSLSLKEPLLLLLLLLSNSLSQSQSSKHFLIYLRTRFSSIQIQIQLANEMSFLHSRVLAQQKSKRRSLGLRIWASRGENRSVTLRQRDRCVFESDPNKRKT